MGEVWQALLRRSGPTVVIVKVQSISSRYFERAVLIIWEAIRVKSGEVLTFHLTLADEAGQRTEQPLWWAVLVPRTLTNLPSTTTSLTQRMNRMHPHQDRMTYLVDHRCQGRSTAAGRRGEGQVHSVLRTTPGACLRPHRKPGPHATPGGGHPEIMRPLAAKLAGLYH